MLHLLVAQIFAFSLIAPHFLHTAEAAVVSLDFKLTWVWANPDGKAPRPVIGVNGQWPLPTINATVGDVVLVKTENLLGNQSASLHWHGLFMNGTAHMDGTSYVSQCSIAPNSTFLYNFTIQQPGTYWYHSHEKAQYPDGLRGLLIVNDPLSPFRSEYDEEIVLSVSDWYHGQMADLVKQYGSSGMLMDPPPDGYLINDMINPKVQVKPGKTYLVRIANIAAFASHYFWVEGHSMKVVEVDGVYTQPMETNMLLLSTGQRYSFLLTTKESSDANYAMVSRVDLSSIYMHGGSKEITTSGWFVYDEKLPLPQPQSVSKLDALDDLKLVPFDEEPLLDSVDQTVSLEIEMGSGSDGRTHWMFNNVNYEPPVLPSIFTALTTGGNASLSKVYGKEAQAVVLGHQQVIEIAIRHRHMMKHPLHLHGHNFQIVNRSGGRDSQLDMPPIPPRRDTIIVSPGEDLKLRFRSDNPGVWLFHCHMEWHAYSGLMATFVEAPLELQQQHLISQSTLNLETDQICQSLAHDSIVKAESTKDLVSSTLSFLKQPMVAILLVSFACILAFGCVYVWRMMHSKPGSAQAYSLVPMNSDEAVEAETEFTEPRRQETL